MLNDVLMLVAQVAAALATVPTVLAGRVKQHVPLSSSSALAGALALAAYVLVSDGLVLGGAATAVCALMWAVVWVQRLRG
jgi:hypothetical protein